MEPYKMNEWWGRIASEYNDFLANGPWGIFATVQPDDLSIWTVEMHGPKGSAYEGGIFKGVLEFDRSYPFSPPTFNFLTPTFHPNISPGGKPCVDKICSYWTPGVKIWSYLAMIQFFLDDPNPDDPVNEIAALYFKEDLPQYEEIVKECVRKSIDDRHKDSNGNGMDESSVNEVEVAWCDSS